MGCILFLLPTKTIAHRSLTQGSFYTHARLHAEAFADRTFYTQELLHTESFTQRSFYTEKSLYRGVFTPRRVDPQKLLHADAFTQKKYTQKLVRTGACTQSRFYTEQLLHREVFTQRRSMATQKVSPTTHKRVYTQKLVHREAFTQRVFYTQKLLCTEAFTHIFAHRNFYAEELLRTEAFTHREVLTQTKLCDVARPQFHPSFCRLTFMSCEMVASAISKSHFYDSDLEIALLRQFFPFDFHFVRNGCAYDFKIAISQFLTFGHHFARKGDVPGHQEFDHTSVRPTRAISAEGCAGERKIRLHYSPHLRIRPARSPHTGLNRIRMSPPVCASDTRRISAEPHQDTFAFHHTFGRLTRTISAEGCSPPRQTRIAPYRCAPGAYDVRSPCP